MSEYQYYEFQDIDKPLYDWEKGEGWLSSLISLRSDIITKKRTVMTAEL
ncbi:MAG: hypothetical protein JRE64_04095 [Deltaproteobacteria bacterium]|nr:hypothetical protein [Deltaproteobacteria bacterium]